MTVIHKDRGWKRIMKRMRGLDDSAVRIGFFGQEDVGEDGITVVELAAIHEYGAPSAGIPERSFLRRTFREAKKELNEFCLKLWKRIQAGELDEERALKLLGEWGAAMVKKRVTAGEHIPPPLQQATIDAKGSDRPLVDTGRMINAVTYDVRKK